MTLLRHLLLSAVLLAAVSGRAATFGDESLNYEIVYHWGLIWKHAGNATLSIRQSGDSYSAKLTGRSISWADKFFKVRDTLTCTILREGFRPVVYKKTSHEGKHHVTDIVRYSYRPGESLASCTRLRPGKETQQTSLQTSGQAYDMLSIFYYLRTLDFSSMKQGDTAVTTMFSGRKKETLTIKYVGVETIELRDDSKHKAHHVTFTFTQGGQAKSSDDIHTWLSTDALHVPLMLKGKLSVGEIRCYLAR